MSESICSTDPNAVQRISSGINWAYLSTGTKPDAATITALFCAMTLITLTGYLIICNIFQLSVLKDIRRYGLLKIIGTTNRQIKAILRRQATMLSFLGIPLGLVSGYIIGKSLVPSLMARSSNAGSAVVVSPQPLIFTGATLFSLITVFISISSPAKIAAGVSPLQAIVYTEGQNENSQKNKRSKYGATPHHMAFANLGRNKKRSLLVILSLSLSLILANTVFTFSQSVDMNKAIERFHISDFLIGHTDFFNIRYRGADSALSEHFIEEVAKQPGFEDGGRLYATWGSYRSQSSAQTMNLHPNGSYSTAVYGLDSFFLARLNPVDGEIDETKMASGNYVLEGVRADDHGNVMADSFNHKLGDRILLTCGEDCFELTVLRRRRNRSVSKIMTK